MASPSPKECPICHEEYDEEEWCPRSLPCCHTLCTKCIDNLISRNLKTCPFCIRGFKASTFRDVGVNTSLLDLLKLFRESVQSVPSPCVGEVGKHSNRMNYLKRETDEVINKLLDSVQEADDEIDRNLQSNDELESSLIHTNEIISDLLTENVKQIDYLKEQRRRLKNHKILINDTRNILRTAKNKLASAGTFMQIAEVADDMESRKTDTEKHLPNFMVHMVEDEKTRLKLEKVVHLTMDPIEKLKKILKSSRMDNELNFTPDIDHMKIQDFIPQVTIFNPMAREGLSEAAIADMMDIDIASDEEVLSKKSIIHMCGDLSEVEEPAMKTVCDSEESSRLIQVPPCHPSPCSSSASETSQSSSPGAFYGRRKRVNVEQYVQRRKWFYTYSDSDNEESVDDPVPFLDSNSRVLSSDPECATDSSKILAGGSSAPGTSKVTKPTNFSPVKVVRNTPDWHPTSGPTRQLVPRLSPGFPSATPGVTATPPVSAIQRGCATSVRPATSTQVQPISASQVPSIDSAPPGPPETATSPVTGTQVQYPVDTSQLTSSQLKSRKRARGSLRDDVGTPLVKLQCASARARDGSIWHRDPNPVLPRVSRHRRVPPGDLTTMAAQRKQPEELFELFVPDVELAAIVYYTNTKINSLRAMCHSEDKATFGDVTLMEMKALLGILIMSGIKEDNHVGTDQMWSPLEGCPFYRSIMSNRRFCFLMRAIRFDNSETRQQRLVTDKLAPIRSLWNACVAACTSSYVPGPHFTVGEQLLAFRGMYIANKPAKYGLKIVMLCDSDTHFMCNALPYLGEGSVTLPRDIETHGEYYLVELTNPFPLHGRTVTTNKWFTTLQGALTLRDRGLDFVGGIKPMPYLPEAVFDTDLQVGETVAAFNYDKKVTLVFHKASESIGVQFLTTIHHNPMVIENGKTDAQMFYNSTNGGVHTFDQLCITTSCSRMTNRWPLCFFFGILNIAFTNSYILHQVQNRSGTPMTRRAFGLKLAEELSKPWALGRLQLPQLTRELRVIIESVYSIVPDDKPQEPAIPLEQVHKKRMRCNLCPRSSYVKSTVTCSMCNKYTCPRHYSIICDTCAN